MHLYSTYGKGLVIGASALAAHSVLVGIVIALVAALIVWLVLHLIAPAYDAVAAAITFLVVLVVLVL